MTAEPPAPQLKTHGQTQRTPLWSVKLSSEIRKTKLRPKLPPWRHPQRPSSQLPRPPSGADPSLGSNGPQLCQLLGLAFTPGSLPCCQENIRPQKCHAAALRAEGTLWFPLINHISSSFGQDALPTCIISSSVPSQLCNTTRRWELFRPFYE